MRKLDSIQILAGILVYDTVLTKGDFLAASDLLKPRDPITVRDETADDIIQLMAVHTVCKHLCSTLAEWE